MTTLTKINSFVEALAEKVHNLQSDSLKIALTNTAHTSTWTKLSDLTEISYTNCSSRAATVASSAQTGGTYKLCITDITLTASGGSIGPFRYVYLYNDTATNKELIGYIDYGSAITMTNGQLFQIDFDDTNGVLTLA